MLERQSNATRGDHDERRKQLQEVAGSEVIAEAHCGEGQRDPYTQAGTILRGPRPRGDDGRDQRRVEAGPIGNAPEGEGEWMSRGRATCVGQAPQPGLFVEART